MVVQEVQAKMKRRRSLALRGRRLPKMLTRFHELEHVPVQVGIHRKLGVRCQVAGDNVLGG